MQGTLFHLRRNAVAYLALFVALGGTSFAAATMITGKDVKDSSLTGVDVKTGSLTGSDVKNQSLAPSDFNGSVQGPKSRPSHATVAAYLALFVALGGTSYAAVTLANNSVKSKHIANGNVKRSDIATNAVNSAKIAAGSLTSSDFAAGQIPPGPTGPAGPAGAKGTDGSDATINGVAAGGDLTGTYPNPVIGDAAVTGAKVANGTLHIGDVFTHAFTQSRNFVSVPAHGCTGSTVVSAFGSPGDIVLAFPPPDLGSPLIMPPTTFGTANELSLKICNIGDTPIDPPAQNYTVFVLTG